MSECTSEIHVVYQLDGNPRVQFFVHSPCGKDMGLVAEMLDIHSPNPVIRFHIAFLGVNLVDAICSKIRMIMGAKKIVEEIKEHASQDQQ